FKASTDLISIRIEENFRKKLLWLVSVLFALTIIQMILGTQVREAIDLVKGSEYVPPRSFWIDSIGTIFPIHRSFSWLIFLAGAYLFYMLRKEKAEGLILQLGQLNIFLILLQLGTGLALYYYDMPRVLQVLHLVGIALMVCAQFLFILVLGLAANKKRKKLSE
ncbi:MAG: COX15/CtaA family protein, partial [Balneolaceae bacterium]